MFRKRLIFILLLITGWTDALAIPNLDSLEQSLQSSTGEAKLYALAELAWYYHNIKPSKAIGFANEGLAMAKEKNLLNYQTEFNATLGANYFVIGDYYKSIEYYRVAIKNAAKLNDSLSIASYYNNIGTAYKNRGLYDSALAYYRKGSDIYFRRHLFSKVAASYSNIASIYESLNKLDNAYEYYYKALKINISAKDSNGMAMIYNNLALIFQRQGELNKAENYLYKTLEISRTIGDSNGVVTAYANIGLNYELKKDYTKALEIYQSIIPLCKEIEDVQILINLYNYLGSAYYHLKQYDKAIEYVNKSLSLSKEKKLLESMEESYGLLQMIYVAKGDYKSAYDYLLKYSAVHDSLFDARFNEELARETARATSQLQVKLDVEKKNNKILRLSQKGQKQKIYLRFLIVLAAVFLIFIIVILILHRNIRKKNKNLEDAYRTLSAKDAELRKTIAIKDKFFRIIAHDLKTPLSIFINVSDYLINNYNEMQEEDIRTFLFDMQNVSKNLNALLDDLLLWAKIQTGSIQVHQETIDLGLLSQRVVNELRPASEEKEQSLNAETKNNMRVQGDTSLIYTILKNLLQNAIKFTPNRGKINVKTYIQNGKAVFEVSDTGVGISEERKEKLFSYEKVKTYGTNRESGTGIGLVLSKEIAELHNGNIEFDSTKNAGSTFRLILPLINT